MATKNWSKYQKNIFAFTLNETGNAIIEAVAGSGKSTTILECMNLIPSHLQAIFLAFNKSIADELKERGVNARTFHSLTYMPVTKFKNVRQVEPNKLRKLVDTIMTMDQAKMYAQFAIKLVGLARNAGIGCLVEDTESEWLKLVNHYDVDLDNENATFTEGIAMARKLLQTSNASAMVDFDDLLFIAVKEGISLPKFDYIMVDEVQDTNAIQRAILRKIMKPTSRIICVGDPAQAIYGFRGADSNSMDLIASEFNCKKLPLTVSYRCPTSVIEYAQQWVSHIEAAPKASKGEVKELGIEWKNTIFKPNDLVVCRTTAPLIELAYSMLKERIPVRIMGKDIGEGLKALINKMNAKGIDKLIQKLHAWKDRETEKAIAKKQEDKAESIQDKHDAIIWLIETMDENKRTIPELLNTIDKLFSNAKNTVVLSTIHKAKGLEADNVFWLNASQCPAKWAKLEWQKKQEINLCYVAATRAKKTLTMIEME